jgi:hypothetical protein
MTSSPTFTRSPMQSLASRKHPDRRDDAKSTCALAAWIAPDRYGDVESSPARQCAVAAMRSVWQECVSRGAAGSRPGRPTGFFVHRPYVTVLRLVAC